ncbi:cell wall-binding repeat-containing protein [Peptostreptococcus sp.]|uniref:cell wall-binding repeat-containing protein n=1 Tax=Peptostreptococcus sp. TaxID=1262 RepID=UPI002FC7DC30
MKIKIRKALYVGLVSSMISTAVVPALAANENTQSAQSTVELGDSTKDKEDILPENINMSSTINSKTARINQKIIQYIDNVNFENYKANSDKELGLKEVKINIYPWNRYDDAAELEKIVIPWTEIEKKMPDGSFKELSGVRIILNGYSGIYDTFIKKDFKYDGSSKEDMIFTRKEMTDYMDNNPDYQRAYKDYLEANPGKYRWSYQMGLIVVPLDKDGKEMTFKDGITKMQIDGPIEVHYISKDEPTYGDWGLNRVHEGTLLDNTTGVKYTDIYYETSTLKISPDKKENLQSNDKINLDLNLKNTSKNVVNKMLVMGYDVVDGDGKVIESKEISDEDGSKKLVTVKPGEEFNTSEVYTIPDGYKGKKLTFKPYVYGVYGEYDGKERKVYYNPDEKEYDEPVDIMMKESTSGGGNTGGGSGGGGDTTSKNNVILASGDKYTDVLAATVLGNEKKCPILLSEKNQVSDNALKEMKRLDTDTVIISGGPESVSDNVVNQLKKEGYDIRRIAGQNRYETARKIGSEVRLTTKNMDEAILVDGTNFPDVITMSALANQKRVPILLTEPKALNNTTEKTLKDWNIENVTIGGEKISVSQDVENSVKSNVKTVDRIGGHDRYETAYKVADEVRSKTNNKNDMILVDGTNFPDGITISSLSAKFKAPILLTTPNTLHPTTAKAINDWTIENILIGGGYNSVSKSIEDNLGAKNKERVAGSNRYNTAVEISKRYTNSTSLGKN